MPRTRLHKGYTLVEMVLVIIIIGILAAIAIRSLGTTLDVSRTEETKTEMRRLAYAIAGNPELVSGGVRTDFGYVGDIGALPPNWDALVTNPGYATWRGPYIGDDFSSGVGDYAFKLDAWGQEYTSPSGSAFSSTGGPQTITREIATSNAALFNNSIILSVEDVDHSPPGAGYCDSIRVELSYPDGTGGLALRSVYPSPNGLARFDSIPIGLHRLRIIYLPENDTLDREIAVNPGRIAYIDMQYFGDVW